LAKIRLDLALAVTHKNARHHKSRQPVTGDWADFW